jgi:FkbM family methyltransferase
VYAFDADVTAIRLAASNIERSALACRVQLFHLALGPATPSGFVTMRGRPGSSGPSMLPLRGRQRRTQWSVPVMPLHDWATRVGLDCSRVRLVKVDVEGAELPVMLSMLAYLRDTCGSPDVWLSLHTLYWPALDGGAEPTAAGILDVVNTFTHVYGTDLVAVPREQRTTQLFTRFDTLLLSMREHTFRRTA